ncbi:MAG: TRM11 family SAM-dependent methyltransferase [Thermocrispum sp.]
MLQLPSANRVYADAAPRLLRAELAVFGQALGGGLDNVAEVELGGLRYTGFTAAPDSPELPGGALELLSNASSLYGLFERIEPDLLRPVPVRPLDRFDSDLLTIQKYPGKTNEQFTRLLVNLTCLAMAEPLAMLRRPLRLLDPLCGRGTTLNQAMMYGFDATGVELDGKDFDAYERFIKTWLRGRRLKHTAESGQLRQHKQRLGRRLDIGYAASKEAFKSGDLRTLAYRAMDTLRVDELFGKDAFDVIVTDAPYGVQHGSHQGTALQRSPRDLLAAAIPVWTRVLRPGGAIGISWNTLVLPRAELVELLAGAGLGPREGGPYEEFGHRVDQAIERDLVVAAKPA